MYCGAACVDTSQRCKFIVLVSGHPGCDAVAVMYRCQCFREGRCLHLHGRPIILNLCCYLHCCEILASHGM
jgi:hypothetical protein